MAIGRVLRPGYDEIFTEPPMHKVIELETAAEYFNFSVRNPDEIGRSCPIRWALTRCFQIAKIKRLFCRKLLAGACTGDGVILGMLIDPEKVQNTPVLPAMTVFPGAKDNFGIFFSASYCQQNQIRR